ncbi:MAG: FAD-dependent oxidoreductase, partial [Acidobacteria bacterium]|nr:FAD-dependent oxidoreductase [Acidobacteriota bacterium]
GLSCAFHLARRGHRVIMFDAAAEPGGMLRYGIPSYRLPRIPLDAEIASVLALGIEFRGHASLGDTLRWGDLRDYDAVFLAIGAQRSRDLDLEPIASGLDFLREVNRGHVPALAGRVAIVGGGNTAIDVARVALRLGAEPIVVYRRSRDDMPAHPDEVAQAQAEGVRFIFHAAPARVLRHRGRVTGVEIQRMRPGAPDASGRPRPEPIPAAVSHMHAQQVFAAVGEEVDIERFAPLVDAARGRLAADRWGRTKQAAVFAGGDAATAAGTVVDAIGSGRRAADAIDAHFAGRDLVVEQLADRVGRADLNFFYFRRAPRIRPPMLDRDRATRGFDEVIGGLAWAHAAAEAARCFTCGACTLCDNCRVFCPDVAVRFDPGRAAYQIDLAHCKGCGVCVEECPRAAIELVPEA